MIELLGAMTDDERQVLADLVGVDPARVENASITDGRELVVELRPLVAGFPRPRERAVILTDSDVERLRAARPRRFEMLSRVEAATIADRLTAALHETSDLSQRRHLARAVESLIRYVSD